MASSGDGAESLSATGLIQRIVASSQAGDCLVGRWTGAWQLLNL
jgi:hypothetical protein